VTLKVVISGCARGATRWAYESIKRAGHNVGFCSVFNENSSSQHIYAAAAHTPYEIEVSWFSAPFLEHPVIAPLRTVQLCRSPFATASSISWSGMFQPGRNDLAQKWYNFVSRFVPDLDNWYRGRPGQSAMYYLCEWHKFLSAADHTVRAEDGVEALLRAAGLENKTGIVYNNLRCNSSACRMPPVDGAIEDLPIAERFMEIVEEQGYVCDKSNESAQLPLQPS
jgi:hypothetical protein